jgi:hypothetical protein
MEQLLVLLVGELGVGDAEAPLEVAAAGFGEAAVGLGVDAGDEEAGDALSSERRKSASRQCRQRTIPVCRNFLS